MSYFTNLIKRAANQQQLQDIKQFGDSLPNLQDPSKLTRDQRMQVLDYLNKANFIVPQFLLRDYVSKGGSPAPSQERLGIITSMLAPVAIGGTLGGLLSKNTRDGFNGGGIVGAGVSLLGTLAGAIMAAATKTRTQKQQLKADQDKQLLANYLLPGSAMYNKYKAIGAARKIQADRAKRKGQIGL